MEIILNDTQFSIFLAIIFSNLWYCWTRLKPLVSHPQESLYDHWTCWITSCQPCFGNRRTVEMFFKPKPELTGQRRPRPEVDSALPSWFDMLLSWWMFAFWTRCRCAFIRSSAGDQAVRGRGPSMSYLTVQEIKRGSSSQIMHQRYTSWRQDAEKHAG